MDGIADHVAQATHVLGHPQPHGHVENLFSQLDRTETVRHVQEVLTDVLNLSGPPRLEDRLVEDLGAESVDVLSLLFEFEERLGRRLPDEQVAGLVTVGDLVDRLLAAGS